MKYSLLLAEIEHILLLHQVPKVSFLPGDLHHL
jgi:hypothetical protein